MSTVSVEDLKRERVEIEKRITASQAEAQSIRDQLQKYQEMLSDFEGQIKHINVELEEIRSIKAEVLQREESLDMDLLEKQKKLEEAHIATTTLAQQLSPVFLKQKNFEEALLMIDQMIEQTSQIAQAAQSPSHTPPQHHYSPSPPQSSRSFPTPPQPKTLPKPPTLGGGLPKPPTLGGGLPKPPTLGGGLPKPPTFGGGLPKPSTLGGGFPKPSTLGKKVSDHGTLGGGFSQLGSEELEATPSHIVPPITPMSAGVSSPSSPAAHPPIAQSPIAQSPIASPVLPAERSSVKQPKRAPRVSVNLELQFELNVTQDSLHNFYTGFMNNISEGGLFIATEQLIDVGTYIQFKFLLPTINETVHAKGVVRWVRDYDVITQLDSGMGVEFIDLDPAHQEAINQFIRQRETIFYED